MASELFANKPDEVAFLDFHGQNFDGSIIIKPIQPDRIYWKNMFATALDDLAQLVVPQNAVLCEGKKIGERGRKPSFDVAVYRRIFGVYASSVEFLPLGGHDEVQANGAALAKLMTTLAPGIRIWAIFDRDDRSKEEIEDLRRFDVRVLGRRDLENYLWDDDILRELCRTLNRTDASDLVIQEKQRLLAESVKSGRAPDDVKAIAGDLYNFIKVTLRTELPQGFGNCAEAFAIATLAPLFSPAQAVYRELASVVLAPLQPPST
jgi:hypothetical protein